MRLRGIYFDGTVFGGTSKEQKWISGGQLAGIKKGKSMIFCIPTFRFPNWVNCLRQLSNLHVNGFAPS
jgi:hypothetical protein